MIKRLSKSTRAITGLPSSPLTAADREDLAITHFSENHSVYESSAPAKKNKLGSNPALRGNKQGGINIKGGSFSANGDSDKFI